jgi:hypothetical protein
MLISSFRMKAGSQSIAGKGDIMSRIVIDLSRDLPPRAATPTEQTLAGIFGGWVSCVGKYCRSNADCCQAPPTALVPIVCNIEGGLGSPLNPMGRCRFYGFSY